QGFSVDGLTGPAGNETSYINKCVWVEGDEGVEVTPIDGFEMRNMFIQNCGTECVRLKNFVTGASISDNTIQNCGIWDYQFARGEKNGEGIYIGTSSKQWTYGEDRCNSNYISGNTITTNGNECVDIKEGSTENVIESNYCSHQLDEYSGCFSSRSDANTFRNNQASDCKGAGIRLGGWLVDGYQYGQTNNVYNNDVADAAVGFIKIETMSQGLICGNTCEDGACEPFSEDSSLPVASTPSSDDSTTEESTSSSDNDSTAEESTSSSTDDSTTEESTSSSDEESTTEESTSSSSDDSTTEESTSSSYDDSTTEESTSSSSDDSTTEEPTSSSDDDSTTEESTSSSYDDSTTEESTPSSDDDSTAEESTSSSTDDSTTEESTSSSDDDSTTEESTSSSDEESTTEESTSSSSDD
ncbi:unnamed protein product, partial [Ascophyllum nodosum]